MSALKVAIILFFIVSGSTFLLDESRQFPEHIKLALQFAPRITWKAVEKMIATFGRNEEFVAENHEKIQETTEKVLKFNRVMADSDELSFNRAFNVNE